MSESHFSVAPRDIKVGTRFGRLVTIGPTFRIRHPHYAVVCQCDCGAVVGNQVGNLRSGDIVSCGCYRDEIVRIKLATHGYSRVGKSHPLYRLWGDMIQRCVNPNRRSFDRYGGRGISVCDEWLNDPVAFIRWGEASGYKKGLQIDRIDNDGNYEPSNCRFVPNAVNVNNRSVTVVLTAFGETKALSEWAQDSRCQCSAPAIYGRVKRGMSPELAIATPLKFRRVGGHGKHL